MLGTEVSPLLIAGDHPHLAIHEHGEQPVAEGWEFLVLAQEMFFVAASL